MTATVKVQYVNEPKPGKKYGSIKSDDGTYYEVTPEMLGQFTRDGQYQIEYTSRTWQGKQYHTVTKVFAEGMTPQNGQQSPQIASQQAGTANGRDDRSNRIERQHSQEMAIRVVVALVGQGVISTEKDALDRIAALTDVFQIDVGKLPTTEGEVF